MECHAPEDHSQGVFLLESTSFCCATLQHFPHVESRQFGFRGKSFRKQAGRPTYIQKCTRAHSAQLHLHLPSLFSTSRVLPQTSQNPRRLKHADCSISSVQDTDSFDVFAFDTSTNETIEYGPPTKQRTFVPTGVQHDQPQTMNNSNI